MNRNGSHMYYALHGKSHLTIEIFC